MKMAAPLFVAFLFCVLTASAEPLSTDQVLAQAEAKATAEHKVIFVHFGASWCGWCKRLDAFLDRPDTKAVFDKYFVPVKLVVQEDEKNKAMENPGGEALLQKLGGPAGLPYSAFLDVHGGLIVDSIRPSSMGGEGNIGFPVQPEEVDWFVKMMLKAAPRMLAALSPLTSVHEANHVTLRARRFIPDLDSDRPFMFIQVNWTGAAVRRMRDKGDFSVWAKECLTYRNEHDKNDTFNKRQG